MDYIEFDLDSAVSTQTAFTGYTALDTPTFSMGRNIQNVVGFKIIETNIPSSYYLVTDEVNSATGYWRNRVLVNIYKDAIDNWQTSFDITPYRYYTATELAAEIATQLATIVNPGPGVIWPITFATNFTFSTTTGKFTLTVVPSPYVAGLEITFQLDATLAQILGFALPNLEDLNTSVLINQTSSTTFSWSSPYTALVTGPNYFQINSLKLSNVLNNYVPEGPLGTIGQTNPAICQVPIYMAYGGLNQWQSTQPDTFDTQNLFQLESFDLYLTLGTSKIPLKLNGLSWQCKVRVFIDTNTVGQSLAGNVEQGRVVKRIRQT